MPSSARSCTYSPWIILVFSSLNVVFLGGKRRAFGIFVAQLHVEFNSTSLAELNWIGDSYAAVGYLTTTLSSATVLYFSSRFGLFQLIGAYFVLLACLTSAYVPNPHWLFLTHTILHGIGSSLILSTVGLVVNEHFDKNHPHHILATTLVSGGSVASIVFVQFYAFLIERYGWRKAFIILGIIYFVVNSSASLVFRRNNLNVEPEHKASSHEHRKIQLLYQRCHVLLLLWLMDRVFTSMVTYGVLLNLADFVHRNESSLSKSAILTTLFATGEATTYVVGAIVTALTKDMLKNRLKYILLVCTFLLANCLIVWEHVSGMVPITHVLACLSGFFLGPSITFLFPAGEEMTGLPGHMAYPFSLAGMGLGMALSPTMSAVIAQAFDYHWFFTIQGILIYAKFICLALSSCILAKSLHMSKEKNNLDEPHERLLKDQDDDKLDAMNCKYPSFDLVEEEEVFSRNMDVYNTLNESDEKTTDIRQIA